jgi:hypothetical protein
MFNKIVILNALKNLQDKLKNLESNANKKSNSTPESNVYSAYPVNTDNEDTIVDDYHNLKYSNNQNDEDEKTWNTEKRISELEKQLAKMRSLLIEDKIDSNDYDNYDSNEDFLIVPNNISKNKVIEFLLLALEFSIS